MNRKFASEGVAKKLAIKMNTENFAHYQISLILNKENTTWLAFHTGKVIRPEIFVLLNAAAYISLPKFI